MVACPISWVEVAVALLARQAFHAVVARKDGRESAATAGLGVVRRVALLPTRQGMVGNGLLDAVGGEGAGGTLLSRRYVAKMIS